MSADGSKQAVANRRRQQRQARQHAQQTSSSNVSEISSAWDTSAGQSASAGGRPITPGRRGDVQAQRPHSAGGRSRRAKERAEDNAGSALKAKQKLEKIITQLKDSQVENHPAEINIESCRVGDRGAVNLSYALRNNSSVQRLRLGGCEITYAGLRSIRDVMRDLKPTVHGPPLVHVIRRIELCTRKMPKVGNPLGNHGAECLAEVVRTSSSLRHVNVSCCSIGDEGATCIAEAATVSPSLVTLELDQNVIGNTGAVSIGQALQRNRVLQGVSLWKNRIGARGAEGLAEGISTNSTLQWLGLGCNKISDEGATHLAKALSLGCRTSKLSWLAVGGNSITDTGAVRLARALQGKTADRLDVSDDDDEDEEGSSIDDATAASLPALRSLGIGGNDISDEAAEAFGSMLLENDVLTSLGLSDCTIGDDGARHLAIGLQGNDTLQRLVLSGNCISDEGAGYLASSLSQNRSLKSLYLAENPITDDGGHRFKEVLCGHYNDTLVTLDIHETDMSVQGFTELCNILRKNSNLQQLGTHLSLIDLASSSVNLDAHSNEVTDGGSGISPTTTDDQGRVLQTVRGNALQGQKKLKTGSSFRNAQATTQRGVFRARGSATAAAVQALPTVGDMTSAEVALEGFRTFDDESTTSLNETDGQDAKHQGLGSRILNFTRPSRRSYIFSDRNSLTSPSGSEGRKKRWSLFGNRKASSATLSGSQTELISLSEDQKHATLTTGSDQLAKPMPKQPSQASLPPPPLPADLDAEMPDGGDRESSFGGDLPPPPPVLAAGQVRVRKPKQGQKRPASIVEPTIQEDAVLEAKSKTAAKSRNSVIVDPNAALSGGWRRGRVTPSSSLASSMDKETNGVLEEMDDDNDDILKAWASQAPNEGEGDRPQPKAVEETASVQPKPTMEVITGGPATETKTESPRKESRRRKSDVDQVKEEASKGRLSPLLSRIPTPRRSKRNKKRKFESEEVTVEQVLMESAKASGLRPESLRVSVVSNASAMENPYQNIEFSNSPQLPQSDRHLEPSEPTCDSGVQSPESDDEQGVGVAQHGAAHMDTLVAEDQRFRVGSDASPLLPTASLSKPSSTRDKSSPVKKASVKKTKSSGRVKSGNNENMEALSQKLNAVLAAGSNRDRRQSIEHPDVFIEDATENDLDQDETDLAIQQISRSASSLSHVTKTRSRPSGRRPPSRETSHSSVQQAVQTPRGGGYQANDPSSHTSIGSLEPITDERASLIPVSKADDSEPPVPLTLPLTQNESLLERLTLLQTGNPLQEQFVDLQPRMEQITYQHDIASSTQFVEKIRPNAPLAPNRSLATLLGIERVSDFTFINASYVGNTLDSRLCIATQAPLSENISDFWRLIWEHRVRIVVSLTAESDGYTTSYSSEVEQDFDLVEAKSPQATVGKIYPSSLKVIHTPIKIHSIDSVTTQDYVLENSRTMEIRSVQAYHYNAWTEEGLDGSACDIALLIEEVLARRKQDEPVLIHCKNGDVRTGAVSACISAAHVMLSASKRRSQLNLHEADVSLDKLWLQTAEQRPGFAHDLPTFRIYQQVVLGCVFGTDAIRSTGLASSKQTSKANIFGRGRSKKKRQSKKK